ncbi:MucBP domain-containing protein [Enterococcus quebecensis]|uniref:Uncharacterized protein n=1 Tax=Enterococcus quebecensis TaxID=903983 RepID=A0A1E5GXN6_9ENTE|nr:MucBP domain-containing protein [Enterococcus quebecensis]OEG17080.1 hypothetical protein BCR23_03475 [Enterococcus quebecensis]
MKKKSYLFLSLIIISFFLIFGSVTYAQEERNNDLDVATGWTIDFNTSFPNINKDDIFIQNHISQALNQKMIINNFANIGEAELTATKSIPMKKGYEYNINLIYAMQFKEVQRGWIDFNGETVYSEIEPYPSDKEYKKTIIPEEDFTYTITIHFKVKRLENGYLKLGYSLENEGIEEKPESMDSSVTARYLLDDGEKLLEDETVTGKVGEAYSIAQKELDGYTLKEVQGEVSGLFTKEPQEVAFIYSKSAEKLGTVTAYYQDEAGNDLEEPMVKRGMVGEAYSISQKEFDGYTLKNIQGEQNGLFKPENQSVIYTYGRIEKDTSDDSKETAGSNVTIYYQDENGNELAQQVVKNGLLGQAYTVDIKDIPGYSLKEIKDDHSGEYVENNQVVICVYIKQDAVSITNQTIIQSPEKIPLLGESGKRILQIIGAIILAALLTFYIVKKRKKSM